MRTRHAALVLAAALVTGAAHPTSPVAAKGWTRQAAGSQDRQQGRPGWPCAGRPDPGHVMTAEATGGQLFMFHPSEVGESGALLAATYSHRETLFRAVGPLGEGVHEFGVEVDPAVESLVFSLSVQCLGVAEIERPSGALLEAEPRAEHHLFETGRVVVLREPEAGTWRVRASGSGLFFLVVQARSSLALGGVRLLKRAGADGYAPTFEPVVPGTRQILTVDMPGTRKVRLVSATWDALGEVSPLPAPEAETVTGAGGGWVGSFVVPRRPFRVVVSGTDAEGRTFHRVHAPLFRTVG